MQSIRIIISIVNITRPDHPYASQSRVYPLSREDVEYSFTKRYYAKCGPRYGYNDVYYATRMTYINDITRARHLALLTHEVVHIETCDGGRWDSVHPREFWRLMAFYGSRVSDALRDGRLSERFPDVTADGFEEELVNDPNGSTVDRRYWTVEDAQNEVAKLIGRVDLAPGNPTPLRSNIQPAAGNQN